MELNTDPPRELSTAPLRVLCVAPIRKLHFLFQYSKFSIYNINLQVSRSDVFEEATLENILNETNFKWLREQTADIKINTNRGYKINEDTASTK